MALAYLVPNRPPSWRGFGNVVLGGRRRALATVLPVAGKFAGGGIAEFGSRVSRREVGGWLKLKAVESSVVEGVQRIGSVVEIPVTCFQEEDVQKQLLASNRFESSSLISNYPSNLTSEILGVPEKAEKDEIVKAAMELKKSEIEDGYTADVIASRQEFLVDVRDKLLFEQEYVGSVKEKVPPKSSLRIPWPWLPAALCLLQEAGEVKLVLEIGRAALHLPDVKHYIHDLLLSMALAECSIAKTGFEKSKVSDGFEALSRAQYLLRSRSSFGNMTLLSQIEESLEELAPACTLELLGLPHKPDNAERRLGAIAALRELLRQGLDVEPSCRVQDWHCFLSQAMKKLMATEIVDLISWDALATSRKNKKLLESQNQRVVIDFGCFYMALTAYIALGFSTRQIDLIRKAKMICECLVASDGMDLKFEEAFCSLLLGQGSETEAVEKLRQLEINGTSSSRNSESITPLTDIKGKGSVSQSLETWLKDAVLCVYPDTRDCSPSLANFFSGAKRIIRGSKQSPGSSKPVTSFNHKSLSFRLLPDARGSVEHSRSKSTEHLGEAVKQLAPANLQSELPVGGTTGYAGGPSIQLRRDLGLHPENLWESWWLTGKVSCAMFVGCLIFGTFKLLALQFGNASKIPYKFQSSYPNLNTTILARTSLPSTSLIDKKVCGQLGKLLAVVRQHISHQTSATTVHDSWPSDDISFLSTASAIAGISFNKTQMPLEEAESLVKQWQDIKSEALGHDHQVEALSEILSESMLAQWQDLANSAKSRLCFWRFVLLQMSILRADTVLDQVGSEVAEIEAVLEEAAELVDESEPQKPSYYSTYKVLYVLRRQDDGSWKFCGGGIQSDL